LLLLENFLTQKLFPLAFNQ
jgi:hypothetical protein